MDGPRAKRAGTLLLYRITLRGRDGSIVSLSRRARVRPGRYGRRAQCGLGRRPYPVRGADRPALLALLRWLARAVSPLARTTRAPSSWYSLRRHFLKTTDTFMHPRRFLVGPTRAAARSTTAAFSAACGDRDGVAGPDHALEHRRQAPWRGGSASRPKTVTIYRQNPPRRVARQSTSIVLCSVRDERATTGRLPSSGPRHAPAWRRRQCLLSLTAAVSVGSTRERAAGERRDGAFVVDVRASWLATQHADGGLGETMTPLRAKCACRTLIGSLAMPSVTPPFADTSSPLVSLPCEHRSLCQICVSPTRSRAPGARRPGATRLHRL